MEGSWRGVRPEARWKMVDWQRKASWLSLSSKRFPRSSRFRESGEVDALLMMFWTVSATDGRKDFWSQ